MLKAIQSWLGSGTAAMENIPASNVQVDKSLDHHAAVAVSARELIALKASASFLSLSSARVKNSSITGVHPSRFRGRGMDYQESRVYQPGDDVRSMDWRVTARAGIPYVKLYEEERERPVMLLVDLNPGMFFASQGVFKSVIAARLAALVAWAGVAKGDRIGGLIFNGSHIEIPPRSGTRGALQIIRELVHATDPAQVLQSPLQQTDQSLGIALERCRRVAKPGSLIFILSDFYQLTDETGVQLMRLRQHSDVVAIQVADALELAPPPAAVYGISDGQEYGVLDTRRHDAQQQYTAWCNSHHEVVEKLMRQNAIPLLRVLTTDDVVMTMRRYMDRSNAGRKSRRKQVR